MILKNNNLNLLLDSLGLTTESINEVLFEKLNSESIRRIKEDKGNLPELPPFEKHPYIENLPDKGIEGLMIGTFPPISYLCDSLNLQELHFNGVIGPPDISYFHGNFSSLWKYCPIKFDEIKDLRRDALPKAIAGRLEESKIGYTDIIKFCQRDLVNNKGKLKYTANDTSLSNIVINEDVYDTLWNSSSINRIYFTNSSFFGSTTNSNYLFGKDGSYKLKQRDAFRLFLKGANDLGFDLELSNYGETDNWYSISEGITDKEFRNKINKAFTTKTIIKLRITKVGRTKVFDLYSAVSPAAVNRGTVRKNNCVLNYKSEYGVEIKDAPRGLLENVLKAFFTNYPSSLLKLNHTSI